MEEVSKVLLLLALSIAGGKPTTVDQVRHAGQIYCQTARGLIAYDFLVSERAVYRGLCNRAGKFVGRDVENPVDFIPINLASIFNSWHVIYRAHQKNGTNLHLKVEPELLRAKSLLDSATLDAENGFGPFVEAYWQESNLRESATHSVIQSRFRELSKRGRDLNGEDRKALESVPSL